MSRLFRTPGPIRPERRRRPFQVSLGLDPGIYTSTVVRRLTPRVEFGDVTVIEDWEARKAIAEGAA
jgi:hypothetical protein